MDYMKKVLVKDVAGHIVEAMVDCAEMNKSRIVLFPQVVEMMSAYRIPSQQIAEIVVSLIKHKYFYHEWTTKKGEWETLQLALTKKGTARYNQIVKLKANQQVNLTPNQQHKKELDEAMDMIQKKQDTPKKTDIVDSSDIFTNAKDIDLMDIKPNQLPFTLDDVYEK